MTDVITAVCTACGAENLGTRFCESCGAPAAQATAPDVALPAPPAVGLELPVVAPVLPTDPGRTPRALALAAFLLGIFITTCMGIASSGGAFIPEAAYTGVTGFTAAVVGLLMLIAAATGKASPAGKAMGVLFALAYPLTVIVQATVPYGGYDAVTPYLLPLLGPFFLFLSWAAGRGFRGPGYGGLIVVGLLGFASQFVAPALGGYLQYVILHAAVLATDVAIVVLITNALEGTPARNGQRVEPLTRVALALVLVTFAINGIAGSVSGAVMGWYAVIILLLVVGIIVGHAGFVRAGRRGERGRGIATTALVIGYFVLIANVAIMIWLATLLASLSSLTGLY